MNTMFKIFLVLYFPISLISLVYSAFLKLRSYKKEVFKYRENKQNKSENDRTITLKKIQYCIRTINIKSILKKIIVIETFKKLELTVYFMCCALILILEKYQKTSNFIEIILFVSCSTVLIGLGRFLSYRTGKIDMFTKLYFYFLKILIFLLLSVVFLGAFLQKTDNRVLFLLTIFTLVIYTICFLKYIIDDFTNFIFLIFNLLGIYIYSLIMLGFTFGYFYLHNNSIYDLYKNPDFVLNNVVLESYFTIINIGLKHFFSYAPILKTESIFNACVPFFEFIFGSTFNLAVVGFFISYTASKAFTKNSDETIDLIKQLKNKEFKITVTKVEK